MSRSLYERVLGEEYARLPPALRELHAVHGRAMFVGEARVTTGPGRIAAAIRALIGFPAAAERVALTVLIEADGGRERWTRRFGPRTFRSVLSQPANAARGEIEERFGLLRFRLQLPVDAQGLRMPVSSAHAFGLRLPIAMTPQSVTREYVDGEGRFCFDVDIRLPWGARLVHDAGWLERATG